MERGVGEEGGGHAIRVRARFRNAAPAPATIESYEVPEERPFPVRVGAPARAPHACPQNAAVYAVEASNIYKMSLRRSERWITYSISRCSPQLLQAAPAPASDQSKDHS
ncbi:hypothetical protein NicSoilB8_19220 [Arthrobacter sp. NicSoilB8]|nr:hypothetical protein NicSoilB8_19220 [Arthrobacter sp. NicSoilB8]